jgi:hypothetical protein
VRLIVIVALLVGCVKPPTAAPAPAPVAAPIPADRIQITFASGTPRPVCVQFRGWHYGFVYGDTRGDLSRLPVWTVVYARNWPLHAPGDTGIELDIDCPAFDGHALVWAGESETFTLDENGKVTP